MNKKLYFIKLIIFYKFNKNKAQKFLDREH